jgi:outer membrane protein OmpA-like peptidoglycan-associated protein
MKSFAGVVAVAAGCALNLAVAATVSAQSGPPNQAQMIEQLRPVPSALQGGHQGLPIGGAAPIAEPPRKQYIKTSTAPEAPAPSQNATPEHQPAAAAPASAAAMAGCTSAADTTKPGLSLKWITFQFGSAELRPEAIAVLQTLGKTLKENFPDATFIIEGHTDVSGTFALNQELSTQRAQAVKDYLTKEMSINPDHLEVTGLGYCDLANPNDPRGAENRRVVVVNKAG